MKYCIILMFSLYIQNLLFAQDRMPGVDKSPMDMSYYPNNYPLTRLQQKTTEPLIARIIYSRPFLNGRRIFGDMMEYGKIWRMGANETTEIEFFKDVIISNNRLKKGRYTLYAIPNEKKWTIIFNRETDTWGAFIYDSKKDALRADVPVQNNNDCVEYFTIYMEKNNTGPTIKIFWDMVKVELPFSIAK